MKRHSGGLISQNRRLHFMDFGLQRIIPLGNGFFYFRRPEMTCDK
jgi:hypothetical protein